MRLYEFNSTVADFRKYLTGKITNIGGYILPNGKAELGVASKIQQEIHDPILEKLHSSEEELLQKGAVRFRLSSTGLVIHLKPSTNSTTLAMKLLNNNWFRGLFITIEFFGSGEKYYFGTDLKIAQDTLRYWDLNESRKRKKI